MKSLFSCIAVLVVAGLAGGRLVGSPGAAAAAPGEINGRVIEAINAAGYTYVQVDAGGKKVWAAATQLAAKAGDTVVFGDLLPMTNHQSKALNRSFDLVYFAGRATVNGRPAGAPATGDVSLPAGHPPTAAGPVANPHGGAAAGAPALDLKGILKAANGHTVAEVYAGKARLAGKPVAVRGRVVKFNANIMGKNWLHVRDGSGADGTNDLTVTTADRVKVGDLVVVDGKLSVDRDFGAGYKYGLIVEDAKVKVE